MAKILMRLATVLAAACCVGAGPVFAQANRGVGAPAAPHVSVPAPHIPAPTPHIDVPTVPHASVPAPRVTATTHFNPRVNPGPGVATPRFPARTANVRQFTPRGHGYTPRGPARQTVRGPAATWHTLGRGARRSVTRSASRNFPGRDLTRRATRTTEPNNRPRIPAPSGRNRPSAAQIAALSRPLGERNRDHRERHHFFEERRRFHRGGFVGWFGPVFWPYAYDDFFDYAFWPVEYDDYGFWAYAYDDVLDNVFFTPGTEDAYASVGAGRGRGAERRRGREASRAAARLCRVDPGLTRWPVDEIAQVVEPTSEQRRLLDDLKAASARAGKLLQAACPANPPSTPLGRLDAMGKRLDAMLQALDVVRPALAKFDDSLNDEQKARFNAMGRQQAGGGAQAKDEARLCGTQAPAGLTDEAMKRIEQEVRPDDRQRAGADALRDAAAKAADELHKACPAQTPITPVARLDAMANHIKAMRDAINTVRPALARFYDSLSDEQKAHFNVLSRQASNQ